MDFIFKKCRYLRMFDLCLEVVELRLTQLAIPVSVKLLNKVHSPLIRVHELRFQHFDCLIKRNKRLPGNKKIQFWVWHIQNIKLVIPFCIADFLIETILWNTIPIFMETYKFMHDQKISYKFTPCSQPHLEGLWVFVSGNVDEIFKAIRSQLKLWWYP